MVIGCDQIMVFENKLEKAWKKIEQELKKLEADKISFVEWENVYKNIAAVSRSLSIKDREKLLLKVEEYQYERYNFYNNYKRQYMNELSKKINWLRVYKQTGRNIPHTDLFTIKQLRTKIKVYQIIISSIERLKNDLSDLIILGRQPHEIVNSLKKIALFQIQKLDQDFDAIEGYKEIVSDIVDEDEVDKLLKGI